MPAEQQREDVLAQGLRILHSRVTTKVLCSKICNSPYKGLQNLGWLKVSGFVNSKLGEGHAADMQMFGNGCRICTFSSSLPRLVKVRAT